MTHRASLFAFNPERHRDVRLVPGLDLAAPFLTHHAEIGLDEVADAAVDYPLLFMKDRDTGRLRLVALFGLAPGQNCYVVDDMWQAIYLPLKIAVMPFSLTGPERILCIDEAHPRVTTDEGDALFSDDLSETETMANVRVLLDRFKQGCEAADRFIEVLLDLKLVQPITITAHFVAGDAAEDVQGLYTVDPRILDRLEPAALLNLHGEGWLTPLYAIAQSLNQLNRIKQLHNVGSERQVANLRIAMGGY